MRKTGILILLFIIFLYSAPASLAKTTIELTTYASIPGLSAEDIGLLNILNQTQDSADLNGPNVADGFTFANILGYPIGKSYLGSFPNFEFGYSAGAGCANMEYFDEEDPASDNGSLPIIAPNIAVHAGIGLLGGFDVLAKFFYVSKSMISRYNEDMKYEYDFATLRDFIFYSAGGKLRYNYVKKRWLLPLYLSFGGVTFSLGGDFMYGKISVDGDYSKEYKGVDVALPPAYSTSESVNMQFDGTFDSAVTMVVFSLNAQAVAYLDVFYIFSLYSGFGLAGNIGTFNVEFNGQGSLTTNNPVYYTAFGTYGIGDLTFETKNEYSSMPVIPAYILGLEINLIVIKLNAETMVNMMNGSDVNVQIGTRFEF